MRALHIKRLMSHFVYVESYQHRSFSEALPDESSVLDGIPTQTIVSCLKFEALWGHSPPIPPNKTHPTNKKGLLFVPLLLIIAGQNDDILCNSKCNLVLVQCQVGRAS